LLIGISHADEEGATPEMCELENPVISRGCCYAGLPFEVCYVKIILIKAAWLNRKQDSAAE